MDALSTLNGAGALAGVAMAIILVSMAGGWWR
jgi:hypothetical protein